MATATATATAGQELDFFPAVPTAARVLPWRALGATVEPGTGLAAAAGAAGLYGWDLNAEPLVALTASAGPVPVPGKRVVLRRSGVDGAASWQRSALGVVGDRYEIISNEAWLPFVDTVLATAGSGSGGLEVDSIGLVKGGAVVYVALRGGEFEVGGFDRLASFLVVITSHDGSMVLSVRPSFVRLACTNQLAGMAGSMSSQVFRVRHLSYSAGLGGMVSAAQAALGLSSTVQSALVSEAERLLGVQVTDDTFGKIIAATFPDLAAGLSGAAGPRSLALAESKRATLYGVWHGATVAGSGIGASGWGAVQAVGEYVDWLGTVRSTGSGGDAVLARAVREIATPEAASAVRARAYRAVLALAA